MHNIDEIDDETPIKGSLVLIHSRKGNPSIGLGLVLAKFPSGKNCDVQIGQTKKEKEIISVDDLVSIIQTDGKFNNAKEAFDHYHDDIIILILAAIALSKEYRILRKLKERQMRVHRKFSQRIYSGLTTLLSHVPYIHGKKKTDTNTNNKAPE